MNVRNTKPARELRKYIRSHEGLVVSEATLRPQDLIVNYMAVLEAYSPRAASRLKREYKEVYKEACITSNRVCEYIPDSLMDDAGWLLESLVDELDMLAPRGYSFSSHPGDGACFGYFSHELLDC